MVSAKDNVKQKGSAYTALAPDCHRRGGLRERDEASEGGDDRGTHGCSCYWEMLLLLHGPLPSRSPWSYTLRRRARSRRSGTHEPENPPDWVDAYDVGRRRSAGGGLSATTSERDAGEGRAVVLAGVECRRRTCPRRRPVSPKHRRPEKRSGECRRRVQREKALARS
jgi:hypothetical protein